MMKFLCLVCAVAAAFCPGIIASVADLLAETTQLCCNQGTSYARNHTSQDCSSSVPPDVPSNYGSLCIFAMDQCCKEYFDKKIDCAEGVDLSASTAGCDGALSESARNCCKECLRGKTSGTEGKTCSVRPKGKSAEELLSSDAFGQCCLKEAESGHHRSPFSKKHTTASSAVSSICEEFAPTELCAHHCIPVPGSYKCECNPGHMLMPDGRNCKEVIKNRCKPKNPCQHKCNDNGVEVKCTCRRGYQLQADGKSCKDIDECQLSTPVCLPNNQCFNTLGSYKCFPTKKTEAEKGQCPSGFSRNLKNNVCDDINECSLPHPPCPVYLCENTVGGYKCGGVSGDPANLSPNLSLNPVPLATPEDRCPPGFKHGMDEECEDVDECATKKDDCNHLSQFCINTKGSFYCQDRVSKHCLPGFQIDTETNKCEDIDECLDSQSLCQSNEVCVNVPGAYDCKPKNARSIIRPGTCPDGMRKSPVTRNCEDIDECVEGTHLCDPYQSCKNTNGSHECPCKVGFELDETTGACTDINECALDLSDCIAESQRCDNTVGSYLCVRFTSCGTGYILHHSSSKCEDIDECATKTHNCDRAGSGFQCVNLPGSFRCVRKTTTPLPEYEYEYYDSDEELDNQTNSQSDPKSATIQPDQVPTTTPQPESPIELNPTETSTSSTKPTEFIPINGPSEIQPRPEDKYTTDQEPNIPLQESEHNQSPYENNKPNTYDYQTPVIDTRISDFESSPKPDEAIGQENFPNNVDNDNNIQPQQPEIPYSQPTLPETNFNEPQEPQLLDNIPESNPKLVLIKVPKETATVKGIRSEDGIVVLDTKDVPKNEWTKIEKDPIQVCKTGFEPDEDGACVDIDECATNRHLCSGLTESCHNNFGGYICECRVGFRRDPFTRACDLIITTSSTSTTTTTTTLAPTTTTLAPTTTTQRSHWSSYPNYFNHQRFKPRNPCDAGFHFNAQNGNCDDIDECSNGVANCAAVEVCVNTIGGYKCDCPPNWILDEDRHRCVPNRDKKKFPSGYGNQPVHTANGQAGIQHGQPGKQFVEPTYTHLGDRGSVLKCPWGYRLGDDNTCEDIDECAMGTASCGINQFCTNLPGGYTCSCPAGHNLVGDHECEDVDECALAGSKPICSQNAHCVNTIGSYLCKCHKGFRSAPANDKVCVDVDECTESRGASLCQHRCNNVWGGYRCTCHRGYRLNPDNVTCSDVDECLEFKSKHLCVGRCLNEPGSFKCSCPTGYRLSEDKRSCTDIDECETGEASCSQSNIGTSATDVCLNTRGGYRCERITCMPGYKLENRHRCSKIDRYCPITDWDCLHQPTTYSYNYITFVSKLYIPDSKVDLFTMRGPSWPMARMKFQLRLMNVNAPPSVKEKADINSFLLMPTNKFAVVSLVKSLEGPQSIELELSMELYSDETFAGIAVAKLLIFVSEFEF